MAKYGVSQWFRLKRDAQKWAKKQRDVCYGARVTPVSDGYMVRRTNNPIK